MVLIATACCQLVSIAGKPSDSRQASRMGQFSFYKMGLDARPIYANSKKEYLFFSSRGYWVVSWKAWLCNIIVSYVHFFFFKIWSYFFSEFPCYTYFYRLDRITRAVLQEYIIQHAKKSAQIYVQTNGIVGIMDGMSTISSKSHVIRLLVVAMFMEDFTPRRQTSALLKRFLAKPYLVMFF